MPPVNGKHLVDEHDGALSGSRVHISQSAACGRSVR